MSLIPQIGTHTTMKTVYTTGEAAKICKVSQQTIIRCFDSGQLKGFRVPGSRFRRIPREALFRFMKENGIPTDALESGRRRILIVDDDQAVVDLISEVLASDARFEYKVVNNGFGAGMLAKEYHPDLIILDVMLPDINGQAVCELIRRDPTMSDIKIICISGMVEEDKIDDLRKSGADDFLHKPLDIDELIRRICRLLIWKRLPDQKRKTHGCMISGAIRGTPSFVSLGRANVIGFPAKRSADREGARLPCGAIQDGSRRPEAALPPGTACVSAYSPGDGPAGDGLHARRRRPTRSGLPRLVADSPCAKTRPRVGAGRAASAGPTGLIRLVAERPWWPPGTSAGAVGDAFQRLWRHSVAVSIAARWLAREAGDPDPERLVRAGLLHGLARWAVAAVDPAWIVRWLGEEDARARQRLERSDLGCEFSELGRRLAERWGCGPW